MKRPLVLISIDGFGISPIDQNNPIAMARKPVLDDCMAHYPYGVLEASGIAVGLPWGEVGNSEVGHLNLGAGLVVYQTLPRIILSVENKTFFSNEQFLKSVEHVKKHGSKLHILGITSTGGVHGHIDHIKNLLEFARQQKITNVFVHCIMDGRDSKPQSGIEFIKDLQQTMKKLKVGQIGTLCGRYYSMDRNNAWDRTKQAYDLLTTGIGAHDKNPIDALKKSYKKNIDDEMCEPICIVDRKNNPIGVIGENDAIIFTNYREDRARQLTKYLVLKDPEGFTREYLPANLQCTTMIEYEAELPTNVAFPPQHIQTPFGELLADAGLKQLRIAESEKYAHVTYFFNGGEEKIYAGEDRILVPSPKCRTYDEKPEMSAKEIAKKLCEAVRAKKYDFCLINFANPDMVAHTGNLQATIKAVETVDECIGEILKAQREVNGITAITADHGNAEMVIDILSGALDKEHSTTPVPFMLIDEKRKKERTPEELLLLKKNVIPIGILADVAPTLCELMELTPAPEMTGRSLLNDLA